MWVQLHQLYGHVQLGEHWTWNHPRETWCQAAGSRSLGGTSFAEKKGPERASGDWGQMCNGAITLTDRHPLPNFYAKQEKEERSVGLWEEEKAGIYLSLWLPLVRRLHQLLRGRRRWREHCICIRIHAYTNPVGAGGGFNSAMAFTCWE